jgi:hypothetical protein
MFGNNELSNAYSLLEKRVVGLENAVLSIEVQLGTKKKR